MKENGVAPGEQTDIKAIFRAGYEAGAERIEAEVMRKCTCNAPISFEQAWTNFDNPEEGGL